MASAVTLPFKTDTRHADAIRILHFLGITRDVSFEKSLYPLSGRFARCTALLPNSFMYNLSGITAAGRSLSEFGFLSYFDKPFFLPILIKL